MYLIVQILVGIIAAFHIYILWLEMFAWTTRGPKTFKNFDKELFPKTKALAANQGLYNGFLAAALIWSYFISIPEWQFHARLFILGCVVVAGVYGAFTADKKIFFVQALPAIITVVLMHFVPMNCDNPKNNEVLGQYYNSSQDSFEDIKPLNKLRKISKDWQVFSSNGFSYHGKAHKLTYYKVKEPVPVDGGVFAITLDSIGIIYLESLTWRDYLTLHTNNDSLNNLISLSMSKTLNNAEIKLFMREFESEDWGKLQEMIGEF